MPRGQKKGWKEQQGLVPGTRVPGDENRGIIYTKTSRFAAYFNYANKRCYAGTYMDLATARAERDKAIAERSAGRAAVSLRTKRMLFSAFVETRFFPRSFKRTKRGASKKDSTIRAATSRYRVYLQPFFGDLMLEDVTAGKIEDFRALLDEGTFTAPEIVELPSRIEGGRPRRYNRGAPKRSPRRANARSASYSGKF